MEGTKVVLLCGGKAMGLINRPETKLDNLRGSVFVQNGIAFIPTYLPQDCVDFKNYEAYLNPLINEEDNEVKTQDTSDIETKDRGRTSRGNYGFWFSYDVRKAIEIAKSGVKKNSCEYVARISAEQVINFLNNLRGSVLFLDLETHPLTHQITCFAVSSDASKVLVYNVIDYKGQHAHDWKDTARVLHALAVAFKYNRVVCHNAMFDLFILCWKYKLPPPPIDNIYCTMTAWHRIQPDVEKSLGHLISVATHEIYHKDEGHFEPHNYEQEQQLLTYNAKDVERMALCYYWLENVAKQRGCEASIRQANASIRTYMTMMFRGIRLDTDALCAHIDKLKRYVKFFENRVLHILVGHPLNPRSPAQVAKYLYVELGLPKPAKGELTGKKTLFKILLKKDIPALGIILKLWQWSREAGQISFQLWQGNRVTCAYVITGTESFRLSSRALLSYKSQFPGYGCLLPTTEVFVKGHGWKAFADCSDIETILQWNQETKELSWCDAKLHVVEYAGNMVKSDSKYLTLAYTPDHRVPIITRKTLLNKEVTAKDLLQSCDAFIPLSGYYKTGTINNPLFMRVLAAIQADGSFDNPNYVRFGFAKSSKVDRLLNLCKDAGISVTEISAQINQRRFALTGTQAWHDFIGSDKQFNLDKFLSYDQESLAAFVDELKYWDAHIRGNSFQFYTKHKANADIVATICHLVGYSSKVFGTINNAYAGAFGGISYIWTVAIKPDSQAHTTKTLYKYIPYNGKVYCFQTQTSYFLVRHENQICVTGNTNLQNWNKERVRYLVVPDKE